MTAPAPAEPRLLVGFFGDANFRWRPYRARMLYNWDAVQFALALREFDIAKHQPHPPGYVLYVGLGRLVNATLADPTQAYVTLAMVFSAATTFTVYWPRVPAQPPAGTTEA